MVSGVTAQSVAGMILARWWPDGEAAAAVRTVARWRSIRIGWDDWNK